jgi:hypothetical protein
MCLSMLKHYNIAEVFDRHIIVYISTIIDDDE